MIEALFSEGPVGGERVSIAVHRVPTLLYLVPAPEGYGVVGDWMIMGTDRDPPEAPMEGQIVYELDRVSSLLSAHETYPEMEQGIAIYGFIEGS